MVGIRIENIQKSFVNSGKSTRVLENINIDIRSGEFFFLLGPSGCGKTTLLRIIAGLIEPTAGRIYFDDDDITNLDPRKRNCSLVFQNYALWPHLTVLKNTEFGLEVKKIGKQQRFAEAMKSLELVEMADYINRKPTQLSGGQQQRVALARAIASRPNCLLLDEPLSNLDAKLRIQMRSQLRDLIKNTALTAIYVTHDQKEALAMADRIAVLNNGVIEQIGSPREIYQSPQTAFVADFIGECNFIKGKVLGCNETVVVQTAIGNITAKPNKQHSSGENVLIGIRPENVELVNAETHNSTNTFSAAIAAVTYLGEVTQSQLKMADGSQWKSLMLSSKADSLKPGNAYIKLCPESVFIVPQPKN